MTTLQVTVSVETIHELRTALPPSLRDGVTIMVGDALVILRTATVAEALAQRLTDDARALRVLETLG
jgi:hypothetical protein